MDSKEKFNEDEDDYFALNPHLINDYNGGDDADYLATIYEGASQAEFTDAASVMFPSKDNLQHMLSFFYNKPPTIREPGERQTMYSKTNKLNLMR